MNRKEFLVNTGYACLSMTTLATMLAGCSTTLHTVQNKSTGDTLTISKAEFVELKKDKKSYRKCVIVKTEKYQFPICLFRLADDEFSALLMQCTHNGCELKPEGSFLVCPCHGSEFTSKGIVQNPPAEQNLQAFKTTTDNEHIYIHI